LPLPCRILKFSNLTLSFSFDTLGKKEIFLHFGSYQIIFFQGFKEGLQDENLLQNACLSLEKPNFDLKGINVPFSSEKKIFF